MDERLSKPRQQAERSFADAQSQSRARDRVLAENDQAAQARAEKMLRLKTARLAKEAEDHANMVTSRVLKDVDKA